jgi:aspartyl-tRNA synthetase
MHVVLELLFSLAPFTKRTHTCGALTTAHVGVRVVLAGWLLPER